MYASGAKKNANRYHPAFILVYLPGLPARQGLILGS
jgi:hypothetical protein